MSTKQDVIDAIALVATAANALDGAVANLRDANSALDGNLVKNTNVVGTGGSASSMASISAALDTLVAAMPPLVSAVKTAVANADAVADALV